MAELNWQKDLGLELPHSIIIILSRVALILYDGLLGSCPIHLEWQQLIRPGSYYVACSGGRDVPLGLNLEIPPTNLLFASYILIHCPMVVGPAPLKGALSWMPALRCSSVHGSKTLCKSYLRGRVVVLKLLPQARG